MSTVHQRDTARVVWVLNLAAEVELSGDRLSAAAQRRLDDVRARMALPEGHVALGRTQRSVRGVPGRCWCPTPAALARLIAAGALAPDAPDLETLRRANARQLSHELCSLPGALRCEDRAQVRAAVAPPGEWLLFRQWTFAGRGQHPVHGASWDDSAERWTARALRFGPVFVLPRVEIELEVSLHGFLSAEPSEPWLRVGQPVTNVVDRKGQWQRASLSGPELLVRERQALTGMLERAASALRDEGYFGPFGIDAFRHSGGRFHPLSEINARYSMAWPVGMGSWELPVETARW